MPSRYERACEIVGCTSGFNEAAIEWLLKRQFQCYGFDRQEAPCFVSVGGTEYRGSDITAALTEAVLAVGENDA